MKTLSLLATYSCAAIIFFFVGASYAGTPVWTFTPLTATSFRLLPNETATIQYAITNQSNKPHTLHMTPIPGVTQVTSSGNCGNPFHLNGHESCTLTLLVTGSGLTGDVVDGPIVCQSSALQCYRPASSQTTNIIRATSISLTFPQQSDRVIPVNTDEALSLTITNSANSEINANNVQATLPAGWTNVTQDASNCISIPPGASCMLKFTSTAPYEPGQIIISGSNTQSTPLNTYLAFFDGGGLVFSVQGGTVKVADTSDVFPTKIQWHAPSATGPSNAHDLFDGAANTADIVAFFGNTHDYAAALCVDSTVGGYGDWYLPAMCELGRYLGVGNNPSCGTIPNLLTTLHLIGFGNFITINSPIHSQSYWSSTNNPSIDNRVVWNQNFTNFSISNGSGENQFKEARCVRSFAG